MRRALTIGALIACSGLALVVLRAGTGGDYRVDAVFDTADGIVPGQVVKIAGTKVGSVHAVRLTSGLKARIELQVDRRFAPFHADASCHILPESLISENYVECDPGTTGAPLEGAGAGGVPTVPITRTTEPVGLQDVLDIFALPTSDRLRVMFNELGIATAGEGGDINAILRRANPALGQARRVLTIVAAQRLQVATAVGQTDQVVAELAGRNRQVRSFVDNAAAVLQTTALHRASLGEGVRRLPALLASTRSSFRALNALAVSAPPLLADLRASAPALTTLTSTLPAFVSAATPATRALGSAAAEGIPAARAARPVVADLATFTSLARPTSKLLDQLLVSLRDRGAIESLLKFAYSLSTVGGSYDSLAHLATIAFVIPPCISDQSYPGCDANFHRPPVAARDSNGAPARRAPAPAGQPRGVQRLPLGPAAQPGASALPPTPRSPIPSSLTALLDYLLK
jgi:virulence factor Mce-like protein